METTIVTMTNVILHVNTSYEKNDTLFYAIGLIPYGCISISVPSLLN